MMESRRSAKEHHPVQARCGVLGRVARLSRRSAIACLVLGALGVVATRRRRRPPGGPSVDPETVALLQRLVVAQNATILALREALKMARETNQRRDARFETTADRVSSVSAESSTADLAVVSASKKKKKNAFAPDELPFSAVIKRADVQDSKDVVTTPPREPVEKIGAAKKKKNANPDADPFDGHKILALTADEVRKTPMDVLLSTYGPTRGGGTCENDFGIGLVDRWRREGKPWCESNDSGFETKNASKIECYLVRQTKHAGNGDNLCLGHNVRLNFRDLADGRTPAEYFERYVQTKHQQQHSKIKYSKGTWAASCEPRKDLWKAEYFPGWNVNWFHAFEKVNDVRLWDESSCDVVSKEPTLIVERDTFANLFHNSEDFFNTFIALAILRWPLQKLQILITDLFPKGPFWPLWSRVFNDGSTQPLDAFEIAEKYGPRKKVCFDKAAIGILGAAAPFTVHSFHTKCTKSAIVRAYADLVIKQMGLAERTRYFRANDVDAKRVTVTLIARRSASEWPEKRFCDSKRSFFKCERLGHLSVRPLRRSVKNDADVVRALKALERRTDFKNGARVEVRDVDYATLDFEEQIAIDLDTDVMVGPHGAGLLHNIFMPDRAALVELFVDSSAGNRHFHNLAKWQGRQYFGKPFPNPIPVPKMISLVVEAIQSINTDRPY